VPVLPSPLSTGGGGWGWTTGVYYERAAWRDRDGGGGGDGKGGVDGEMPAPDSLIAAAQLCVPLWRSVKLTLDPFPTPFCPTEPSLSPFPSPFLHPSIRPPAVPSPRTSCNDRIRTSGERSLAIVVFPCFYSRCDRCIISQIALSRPVVQWEKRCGRRRKRYGKGRFCGSIWNFNLIQIWK